MDPVPATNNTAADNDHQVVLDRGFVGVLTSLGKVSSDSPLLWSFVSRWFKECEPLLPKEAQRPVDRTGEFGPPGLVGACILGKLRAFMTEESEDTEDDDKGEEAKKLFFRQKFLDFVYGNVPRPLYDRIFTSLKTCHDCLRLSLVSRWDGPWKPVKGNPIPKKRNGLTMERLLDRSHRYSHFKVRDLCDPCLFNRRLQWVVANIFITHEFMINPHQQPIKLSTTTAWEEEVTVQADHSQNYVNAVHSVFEEIFPIDAFSRAEVSIRCREGVRRDEPMCLMTLPSHPKNSNNTVDKGKPIASEGSKPPADSIDIGGDDDDDNDAGLPPELIKGMGRYIERAKKEEKEEQKKNQEVVWADVIQAMREVCKNSKEFLEYPDAVFSRLAMGVTMSSIIVTESESFLLPPEHSMRSPLTVEPYRFNPDLVVLRPSNCSSSEDDDDDTEEMQS